MTAQNGLLGAFPGGLRSLISPCLAFLLPSFFADAFDRASTLLLRTTVFYPAAGQCADRVRRRRQPGLPGACSSRPSGFTGVDTQFHLQAWLKQATSAVPNAAVLLAVVILALLVVLIRAYRGTATTLLRRPRDLKQNRAPRNR